MLSRFEGLLFKQVAQGLHHSDRLGLLWIILVKVVACFLAVATQVKLIARTEGGAHNHEAHLLLIFIRAGCFVCLLPHVEGLTHVSILTVNVAKVKVGDADRILEATLVEGLHFGVFSSNLRFVLQTNLFVPVDVLKSSGKHGLLLEGQEYLFGEQAVNLLVGLDV